jgi:predicted small secreted protein
MKRSLLNLFSLLILSLVLASCGGEQGPRAGADQLPADLVNNPSTANPESESADRKGPPVMSFERDKWDFGQIFQGEKVEYIFRFTNTGESPLIISKTDVSCGCTAAGYSKEPIPPGGKGEMVVTFDSNGKKNRFNKEVTITANTVPNTSKLYITGNIVVPEN